MVFLVKFSCSYFYLVGPSGGPTFEWISYANTCSADTNFGMMLYRYVNLLFRHISTLIEYCMLYICMTMYI